LFYSSEVSEEVLHVGKVAPVFHVIVADGRQDHVDTLDRGVGALQAELTALLFVLPAVADLVRDGAE
jgi:hypothetical protein